MSCTTAEQPGREPCAEAIERIPRRHCAVDGTPRRTRPGGVGEPVRVGAVEAETTAAHGAGRGARLGRRRPRRPRRCAMGDVSPTELVEMHLARIARLDPQLNTFRIVLAERALAEAKQAEARLKAGEERPLLGVPIALKDTADLAGELTTATGPTHSPIPSGPTRRWSGACGRPARSSSARRTCRRWRSAGSPSRRPGVSRATRGTSSAAPAARAAAAPRRWRRGWSRPRRPATAWARFGSQRRRAGSSD